SDFHLERMIFLAGLLGDPQNSVPSVHIAGTKGKGSTSAMVASIIDASGKKVGLATSPHLHSLRERIKFCMRSIPKGAFAKLVSDLWPFVEQTSVEGKYGGVTWFEFMVMAAFYYYATKQANIQVIETGLGGRLDATNILCPEVSVITSISLDHTKILGDTIELIAKEKSGIIKRDTPVVIAPQPYGEQAYSVIAEVARQHSAHVLDVGAAYELSVEPNDIYTQNVVVSGDTNEYAFKLPLLGAYQAENAAAAIAVSETLNLLGFELSTSNIKDGLEAVHWPGRLQVLQDDGPILMVDGAHNTNSALSVVKTIEEMRRSEILKINRVILVFGVLSGHDSLGVLVQFESLASLIVPVTSRHPRSTPSDLLEEQAQKLGIGLVQHSETLLTVREGIELALSVAGIDDLVLAIGSISVAAEVIEWKENIVPELYRNIPTGIEDKVQKSR
ncbi:MAG TPA: hypothetical protein EYP00_05220, partial [Dehalococcoidia bacterium]|nr:hypothetical protein [Dehalococcoidia bacterium]